MPFRDYWIEVFLTPYVHNFCLHRMGVIPNRKPILLIKNLLLKLVPYFFLQVLL